MLRYHEAHQAEDGLCDRREFMATSDRVLDTLQFPVSYLDLGASLTKAQGGDVGAYYCHCGASALAPAQHSIFGSQLRRSNEWILRHCPPGQPPITTFMRHFPVTCHGALGMLAITSPTLGDALEGALRFFPLVMPAFTLRRIDVDDQVHLVFDPLYDFGGSQNFMAETVATAFLQMAPFLISQPPVMPTIELRHQPLGLAHDYETAFGCRFRFGAADNQLIMARETLKLPLLAASPSSNQQFHAQLEWQNRQQLDLKPISRQVSRLLQEGLQQQREVDASSLASALALSERTLSRRLQEEGSSLPQLRSETSCRYAETLLRETDKSIARIAAMAGFTNATAFTRAFRRQFGMVPSASRIPAPRPEPAGQPSKPSAGYRA